MEGQRNRFRVAIRFPNAVVNSYKRSTVLEQTSSEVNWKKQFIIQRLHTNSEQLLQK